MLCTWRVYDDGGGGHATCRLTRHLPAAVQVIDDTVGSTLAAASTLTPEIREKLNGSAACNVEAAKLVGQKIAEICKERNIERVSRYVVAGTVYARAAIGAGYRSYAGYGQSCMKYVSYALTGGQVCTWSQLCVLAHPSCYLVRRSSVQLGQVRLTTYTHSCEDHYPAMPQHYLGG